MTVFEFVDAINSAGNASRYTVGVRTSSLGVLLVDGRESGTVYWSDGGHITRIVLSSTTTMEVFRRLHALARRGNDDLFRVIV